MAWLYLNRDERSDVVREGISRGLSYEAIGQQHGVSRSVICGHVYRYMRTETRRRPATHKAETAKARARRALTSLPSGAPVQVEGPESVAFDPGEPLPGVMPVRLLDRRVSQCPWILDGRDEDGLVLCCGAPKADGKNWCAAHHARTTLIYQTPAEERGK
ncbi:hypothetical protein H2509_14025 [Stappia sp. F7233]|uniref:GcrA cell cycle regulator n=1 Tax=Stappia albiluteola TaxID=2758565 RepID=A0A839AH60_9HYPH|nr:GcrA family cell cycle regulator [Stappia albiluteola]MBA5778242.1 hypothetical protein [Stappia albiluteola]